MFCQRVERGSTIGEGGDTTISSPGSSPEQPLPGIRLHDPLHGRQACPEFIAFDRGVGQIPVEAIFVPFPPKTGTNLLHPPTTTKSLNGSRLTVTRFTTSPAKAANLSPDVLRNRASGPYTLWATNRKQPHHSQRLQLQLRRPIP